MKQPLMPGPADSRTGERILSDLIPQPQWEIYGTLLRAAGELGIRFALGGGLAASAYSGYVRNTKDMDLFLMPPHQTAMMRLMKEQGFSEYTAVPYDPTWSYRGCRDGYIVDLLWKMLNGRGEVDEVWVTGGWELNMRGVSFRMVPPEELIWSKLYILRRDRTDWPDIMNIIYAQGPQMDWERLLERLGEDAPVLGSVMSLFRWLCPGRAEELPESIWAPLGLLPSCAAAPPGVDRLRTELFKSSDWFPSGG
jgi:hypothetical protein